MDDSMNSESFCRTWRVFRSPAKKGIILIGVTFNTYLFGLVSGQFITYYTSKIKDPFWLKAMVLVMVITDTVHIIALIYMIWVYFVRDFGNPARQKLVIFWPYRLTPLSNAIAAVIVQTFLGYRIYCLTHSKLLFGFISAGALVFFAVACVNGIKALEISLVAKVGHAHVLGTLSISLQIAMDLIVLAILMYHLCIARRRSMRTNLTTVVSRLMAGAIQTGTFGAVFALLNLITIYAFPGGILFSFFGFSTARLYTNTLMHTLNMREGLRGLLDQSYVSFSTFEGTNR